MAPKRPSKYDLSMFSLVRGEKSESGAKKKNTNIQFVLSNPCFEIWLLYYFTEYPAVVSSSQKVKDELRRCFHM